MTTASEGVAVIATQVAKTDRRALSEAWYSALHLAHHVAPAAHGPAVRARQALVAPHAVRPHASPPANVAAAPALRAQRTSRTALAQIAPDDRRRAACATTRTIERAVAALRLRSNPVAAQTIDVAGGRVRLLMRSDGVTTRIVAVCSKPLREPVERALANARFTLAGNGIAVGAT